MPTPSEREIEELLANSLFREFVYRSPKTTKNAQELADAVVVLDDTLLIVQVKLPDPDAPPRTGERLESWTVSKMEDAYRQIGRTWTYIARGLAEPLRNERMPARSIRAGDFTHVIGLAVVGDVDVDARPTLAITKASTPIPVVTLSLPQFRHMIRAFDTVHDFVAAVRAVADDATRVEATSAEAMTTVQCLVSLLTYFDPTLTPAARDHLVRDPARAREIWESVVALGGAIDQRRKMFSESYFIDYLISRMHECGQEYSSLREEIGTPQNAPAASQWPNLITQVARLPRRVRQDFGQGYFTIMREAARAKSPTYRLMWLDDRAHFIVMLSGCTTRKERLEILQVICLAAAYVHRPPVVLGIGTEAGLSKTQSFQFAQPDTAALLPTPPPELLLVMETVRRLKVETLDLKTRPR